MRPAHKHNKNHKKKNRTPLSHDKVYHNNVVDRKDPDELLNRPGLTHRLVQHNTFFDTFLNHVGVDSTSSSHNEKKNNKPAAPIQSSTESTRPGTTSTTATQPLKKANNRKRKKNKNEEQEQEVGEEEDHHHQEENHHGHVINVEFDWSEERTARRETAVVVGLPTRPAVPPEASTANDDGVVTMESESTITNTSFTESQPVRSPSDEPPPAHPQPQLPQPSRIEALRAKLQAKLASLKQHQQEPSSKSDIDQVSKRAARRAEKQRRKQEQLEQQKEEKHRQNHNSITATPAAAAESSGGIVDAGSLGFGRLTGLVMQSHSPSKNHSSSSSSKLLLSHALSNMNTTTKSKNWHKLLANAKEKQAQLLALQQSKDASDQAAAQTQLWQQTLSQASVVSDNHNAHHHNVKRLQHKIKNKAAKKAQSQKAWKSRLDQVANAQKEKQVQRNTHLQNRKQPNKKNPFNPSKNGRSRAGFEGRKQDFLNSK